MRSRTMAGLVATIALIGAPPIIGEQPAPTDSPLPVPLYSEHPAQRDLMRLSLEPSPRIGPVYTIRLKEKDWWLCCFFVDTVFPRSLGGMCAGFSSDWYLGRGFSASCNLEAIPVVSLPVNLHWYPLGGVELILRLDLLRGQLLCWGRMML